MITNIKNKLCCVEIDTPGNSDTIWTNVTILKEHNTYKIEIPSEYLTLFIPLKLIRVIDNSIEIITDNIEMYITITNSEKYFKTIADKTKKLLVNTFNLKVDDLKKYMVIYRAVMESKWLLEKRADGLYIYNKELIENQEEEIETTKVDEWSFWCDYEEFQNTWLALDNYDDDDDEIVIQSFDYFTDALNDLNK